MNPGPFGRRGLDRDPEVAGQPLQLALQILPLADPQEVQVLGPAEPAEGRGGQLPLPLRQVVPQVQVGDEIRVGIGEAAVPEGGRLRSDLSAWPERRRTGGGSGAAAARRPRKPFTKAVFLKPVMLRPLENRLPY